MQKIFILLLCLLSTITNAQERGISLQNNKTETPIVTGNTYAVIVGISNYKYIKPLSFADEDAKLFKEFLQSKAGGNVKEENILLLINDDAKASTHPRIRHWINDLKKPQKGDRVYFYFAGHGDAIDGDEYFFLLQDCDPAGDKNNYIGGMASVLQMYNIKSFIKNTLTDKGVQVVMIWDACRTNELPGGAEGMKNAQQGIAEKNNGEIMMLSASAGETALENNIYAHGHGLFTYYLIDALSGAADNIDVGGNGDGKVDMGELDTWVKMKVRNDAKNKFKSEQHPKFIYNTDVIISTLDEKFKQSWALQKQDNNNYVYNAPKTPRTASAIMDTMVTNLYNQCMYLIKLDSIEGNNGAEAMLTKMQQQYPTNNLTQEAEFNLAMEYINLAQDKINLYLSGLDITASTTVENNFKQKIQKTKGQTYYQSGNFITKAIDLLTATGNYDTTFIQQLIAKKNFFLGRSFYGNEGKVKLRKDAINYARIALQIQPNAAYTNHLLGLLYEQSNNLDSALYYERRAISLAPKWFNCTSLLGDIFRGKKIYDSALYYLKEALKLNTNYGGIYNNIGFFYEQTNQFDSAKFYYRKAILLDPKNAPPYNNIANIFISEKQYDSAKYYYKKASYNLDDASSSYNNIGNFYKSQNQLDSALHYYKIGLSKNPQNLISYYSLCNFYEDKKQCDTAKWYLFQALKIDSLESRIYNNLGFDYKITNQIDSAIYYYQKAIEIDEFDANSFARLGGIYYNLNQYDSAKKYYRKLVNIKSDFNYGFNNLAGVFENLNQLDSAIYYYRKAISIKHIDEDEDSYYNLGRIYQELRQYDSAKKCYLKLIEIFPGSTYYNSLGNTLKDMKQYDSAKICFNKSIELNPKNEKSYNNLGVLYYNLKHYDSAKYCFFKTLALDSNANYIFFNLGNAFYQLKQYDSAIIYYKNSARVNNNIIKSYSKIGWGYIRINNLDSAFFYFTKALKMESNNKSALYNMACYYSITKETDSAIAYLEKSIKAGYDDFENIKTDTDLDNIRNTEKFKALIKKYFPNN